MVLRFAATWNIILCMLQHFWLIQGYVLPAIQSHNCNNICSISVPAATILSTHQWYIWAHLQCLQQCMRLVVAGTADLRAIEFSVTDMYPEPWWDDQILSPQYCTLPNWERAYLGSRAFTNFWNPLPVSWTADFGWMTMHAQCVGSVILVFC